MAAFILEDLQGFVDIIVLPERYKRFQNILENDMAVFLKGKMELDEERIKILLEEIVPLDQVREKKADSVLIKVMTTGMDEDVAHSLKTIMEKHKGHCPIHFSLIYPQQYQVSLEASSKYRVTPSKEFINDIEGLLGKGSVKINIRFGSH